MSSLPLKILIVEDEETLAAALGAKLRLAGYDAVNVYDGEEAILTLRTNKFNLVLLDLRLPKKDGFEVLQELQADPQAPPVVVLSNLSQESDIERAKSLNAKRFFIKTNTSLTDILNYISELLTPAAGTPVQPS
jgi:two-component system OmpR family response regulator